MQKIKKIMKIKIKSFYNFSNQYMNLKVNENSKICFEMAEAVSF